MTEQATQIATAAAPTAAGPTVPAGWYDDPASASHVRWWNGVGWTEHVTEKPSEAARVATTSIPVAPAVSHHDQLRAGVSKGASGTAPSWLIGFSPLIAAVLAVAAGYVYLYLTPNALVFVVVTVTYLLTLLWAFQDVATLKKRGFRPASALFALGGGLVYLVARRVRTAGSGALVAFIALAVLVVGIPGVIGATGAAKPLLKAAEIQSNISWSIVRSGEASNLQCPPTMDVSTPGATYECTVTLPDGRPSTVTVTVNDTHGNYSYHLNQ